MHFSQVLVILDAQRNHNHNHNNKINNDNNNTTNNYKYSKHMTGRLPKNFPARDEENLDFSKAFFFLVRHHYVT